MEEIYKKFTFDFSNPYEIFKILLSSLYLTLSLPRVPNIKIQDKSQISFGKYLT